MTVVSGACARPQPDRTDPASGAEATTIAPAPAPSAAGQACAQFVTAALSVDAGADSGPGDARVRAANQFGVTGLAEQLGGEGRDNTWNLLATHRAHVQVTTEPVGDDPPPVRDDQTGAGVKITRVAIAGEWRQELDPLVAYCSLRRTGSEWKVSGLTLSDAAEHGAGG
ncbi:hypothetical protein [Amycolatopsis coloradensis]|uniref:hypothetical protein n=1 Tax=Amycolatopsis coloradensis TaxID=76021 RepID=UPI001177B2F2|nr:hypothetical protein [Amycolatopsis coloradensis]